MLTVSSVASAQAPTSEAADVSASPLNFKPVLTTPAPTLQPTPQPVLSLLGSEIEPGQTRRLTWKASYGFGELDASAPVLVANGVRPGPRLCITAAVHGDELNGIEMVRRIMQRLDTQTLAGSVIGVPIVNIPGFQRGSRYLPDRRDLNRHFPGDPTGSLASRIGYDFFQRIVRHCNFLVDVHTGSFARSNLPQLRADLLNPQILELTKGFGAIAVLHTAGALGTLRRAATQAGIPTVTLEAGEPDRLQTAEVAQGVKGIESLMSHLGMTPKSFLWKSSQPVFYESHWVRADRGGILFSGIKLGDTVKVGDVLGTVTDPLSNVRTDLIAPHNGKVLGRALNQFVMPGFAAFRLGIETSQEEFAQEPLPIGVPPQVDDISDDETEKN
ncbi:MAG: succinylglutamate desuccinylase/aspartoacylase family protein [Oceanococcus sp.]